MLKDLQALHAQSEFLSQLNEEDLKALSREMHLVSCRSGELLFEAGAEGENVYLLLDGAITLERPEQTAGLVIRNERRAGQLVGEVGFSSGTVYQHSARCDEACRLAKINRQQFNRLLDQSPGTWRKLELMALQRLQEAQLATHLDRVFGPFGQLMPFVLAEVKEHSEWLSLKSGETLYSCGDEADGAYLLLTGRLTGAEVTESGEHPVITVLAGETIGEVALLSNHPRSLTVYAARDSELVKLSRHIFELMLQRSARAMYKISGILINRLVHRRTEEDAARTPIRTISLLPACASVPLRELTESLTRLIAAYGTIKVLNSKSVAKELAMPGVAQAAEGEPMHLRLTEWLHQQENACRYLLYQADLKWSQWTERCARQADRLVVVADATAEVNLGELDARLSGPRQKWSLVLLHPADTSRPRNTRRWLEGTGAESVYHVRRDNDGDMSRLARILSGNAISLVFGGGGARGFAHIGVLKAFEELGIPVDMVAGTSIGASLAGWVAQGLSAEETRQRVLQVGHKLMDFTLPVVSMLKGKRISDSIVKQTGRWDIEDFWLPFFCVSTNITNSRAVIHRRGNSARAVRASGSIPGILPPVPENGELLVDGGVLNNLPIDVMREMNPFGKVIAIDLNAPTGPKAKHDYGLNVSGFAHLLNRFNPFRTQAQLPSIGGIIMQSFMVGSTLVREQALERNLADLYLNIHVRGVGLLEFEAVDKAAKTGYQESIERLRAWKQSLGTEQSVL